MYLCSHRGTSHDIKLPERQKCEPGLPYFLFLLPVPDKSVFQIQFLKDLKVLQKGSGLGL